MLWPSIFFGTGLAMTMALTAADHQVFRTQRERLLGAGAWLLGLPLLFIRNWLSDLPLRPLLLIAGLMLWTLVLVTAGRPAVIMDGLMTPATRAETRTRRGIALSGIAVSIVAGLMIFVIAPVHLPGR